MLPVSILPSSLMALLVVFESVSLASVKGPAVCHDLGTTGSGQ